MAGMDVFGAEERKEVNDVLQTSCLFRYNHEHIRQNMWKARDLENETKRILNAPYVHVVSSGSTAVSTMLAASGIGFGDEIIVTPFTYVAPIESVLYAGALPVFADIDETLNLTAKTIEAAITSKTKAVLIVHMCGASGNMEEITNLCKQKNIILLEDAGQALGAFYKGKSVGLFGNAGSFSMDFFKITTAGEGGLCITNDKDTYNKMEQFTDHGHNHIGENRGMEEHPIFGTNFRISELNAAVGLAQIRKLENLIQIHNKNKSYLKQRLNEIKEISFRNIPDPNGDSGTFLNFFFPIKEITKKVIKQFYEDKIVGANYWFENMYHFINQWNHIKNLSFPAKLAIHHLGAPQDYNNLSLPCAQDVISRLISFGIKANWTQNDLELLADNMIKSIKKVI